MANVEIIVHDTVPTMSRLLERPVADRPDSLREILAPLEGMYSRMGAGAVGCDQHAPADQWIPAGLRR